MVSPLRRFNLPSKLPRLEPPVNVEIVEPRGGLNLSQPASELPPGQSPDCENFVVEDGNLVPRSGLSVFGGSGFLGGDVGLLVYEHQDLSGTLYAIAASSRTIQVFGRNATASWSTLSYVISNVTDPPSGTTVQPWRAASAYDPRSDNRLFVFTNNVDHPFVWNPSQATFSNLSDFISVASRARDVWTLDYRLVFANLGGGNPVTSSDATFPNRLQWSARGNPTFMSVASGGGFEELASMRGEITGGLTRGDDALIFSEYEVWVQRPERSAYAFRHYPIKREIGCAFPRTAVNTPIGVIFLSRDYVPYIAVGETIQQVGKQIERRIRDTIASPEAAFGLYSSRYRRYEFHYATTEDAGRPSRALWLDLDSGGWFPVKFPFEIGHGAEAVESTANDPILWGEATGAWGAQTRTWAQMVIPGSRNRNPDPMYVSSTGTVYRYRPEQATDDGSRVSCHWVSHGMKWPEDPWRAQALYEWMVDYRSDTTSSLSVQFRGSQDVAFGTPANVDLSASSSGAIARATEYASGRRPQFRVALNDMTRPRIGQFHVSTRALGRH